MSEAMMETTAADEQHAEAVVQEEYDEMQSKYLIFLLDGQDFAMQIKNVVDIIKVQQITRVPNCPDFIRGITNLRGRVIPIIDVRVRFGKMQEDYNERTCIIVVEVLGATVGLIIDRVTEVITLEGDQISPPPQFQDGVEARFVSGIGKTDSGIKLILDAHSVLDNGFNFSAGEDEEF